MEKIKKAFILKLISVFIIAIFQITNFTYSLPISSSNSLRAPLVNNANVDKEKDSIRLRGAVAQTISGSRGQSQSLKKCLVLDADGVLWKGIIGEDGINGIEVTSQHVEFQKAVKALKEQGVILAINSKNDSSDIEKVLEEHPQMILRKKDFAVIKANWQDKATNIKEIALELNIGLDSLVFLDDNPRERALVNGIYPDVLTIDPSNDSVSQIESLRDSGLFNKGTITEEDKRRMEFYLAQKEREESKETFRFEEDYYRSLGMKVIIRKGKENIDYIPRIAQLTQRTNQFNLTTKRYSEDDIKSFLVNPDYEILTLELIDKFGNDGMVGLMILNESESKNEIRWTVSTFCLSCRALGKTVEQAFMAYVIDSLKKRYQSGILIGQYKKTEKNKFVENLYGNFNFKLIKGSSGGESTTWSLDLATSELRVPSWIKILDTEYKEDEEMSRIASKNIDELVSGWFRLAKESGLNTELLENALKAYRENLREEDVLKKAIIIETKYVGLEIRFIKIEGDYKTITCECDSLAYEKRDLIEQGFEILYDKSIGVDRSSWEIIETHEVYYAKPGSAKVIRYAVPLQKHLYECNSTIINRIYDICILYGREDLLVPWGSGMLPRTPVLNGQLERIIFLSYTEEEWQELLSLLKENYPEWLLMKNFTSAKEKIQQNAAKHKQIDI